MAFRSCLEFVKFAAVNRTCILLNPFFTSSAVFYFQVRLFVSQVPKNFTSLTISSFALFTLRFVVNCFFFVKLKMILLVFFSFSFIFCASVQSLILSRCSSVFRFSLGIIWLWVGQMGHVHANCNWQFQHLTGKWFQ